MNINISNQDGNIAHSTLPQASLRRRRTAPFTDELRASTSGNVDTFETPDTPRRAVPPSRDPWRRRAVSLCLWTVLVTAPIAAVAVPLGCFLAGVSLGTTTAWAVGLAVTASLLGWLLSRIEIGRQRNADTYTLQRRGIEEGLPQGPPA